MSLTDEERAKVDALKRHQTNLTIRKEKYRILELAQLELDGEDIEIPIEDRDAVDTAKAEILAEEAAKIREEELLAIALSELEE